MFATGRSADFECRATEQLEQVPIRWKQPIEKEWLPIQELEAVRFGSKLSERDKLRPQVSWRMRAGFATRRSVMVSSVSPFRSINGTTDVRIWA